MYGHSHWKTPIPLRSQWCEYGVFTTNDFRTVSVNEPLGFNHTEGKHTIVLTFAFANCEWYFQKIHDFHVRLVFSVN